jgi:hypothetical protein
MLFLRSIEPYLATSGPLPRKEFSDHLESLNLEFSGVISLLHACSPLSATVLLACTYFGQARKLTKLLN